MPEKYLYKDKVLQRKDVEEAAKQSGMDIDTYSTKAGLKRVNDNYNFNGKTVPAEEIFEAAKQSQMGFDDYIQKAKITPIEDVKKKAARVDFEASSLEAGNALSGGVDGSEIPTVEMYSTPSGELVETDPVSLSKKFKQLSEAVKPVSDIEMGMSRGMAQPVIDEGKRKEAEKLKQDFPNIDFEGIYEDTKDLSDDLLDNYKRDILPDKETNNQLYQRKLSNIKWRSGIEKSLLDLVNRGGIKPDDYNNLKAQIDNLPITASQGDYTNQRDAIQSISKTIQLFGGEKKEEILRNFAVEAAKIYGNPFNKSEKTFKDTPESKYLNDDAQLGYQYLSDVDPQKAEQYKRLFIDKNLIKDDPDQKAGYDHLMLRLEETGIGLKQNAITEELNSLNKSAEQQGGLSETQIERAKKLEDAQAELTQKREELDRKYPERIENKVDDALQEIMGQKIGWGNYAGGKAWIGIKNTGQGIWEAVSTPFMSDQSNVLRELAIMGEGLEEEKIYHRTDRNKNVVYDEMVLQPDLQKQIDGIKNNNLLTNDQKEQKLYTLLRENTDKFGRVPIKGGKFNVSGSSILYGLTDLGTSLLPFVGLEAATGGIGGAGAGARFLRTFTAAAATTFHDEYANAIAEGKPQSEAYKSAMASTAINSLAMAGAGTPTQIKAMANGKTSAGKLIQSMSDDAIQKVLDKGTPKGFKAIGQAFKERGKELPKQFSEGLKTGAKFEAYMGAANALNGREQDAKRSMMAIAEFGILGAGLGQIGFKSPTQLQKSAGLEFGKKPEEFKAIADAMRKDGQLDEAQYNQRVELIDRYKEAYKTLPKADAKGNELTTKQKENYLYNAVIKNEGNRAKSNLPPKQAEKAEMTAMVADHKNDLILEPKTDNQLQSRKEQLEKQLEKKDEEGKLELTDKERKNAEAELEAINQTIKEKEDTTKSEEKLPKLSEPIEGVDEFGVPIGENVPPEVKGEPEQITQPIELSVEPSGEVKPLTKEAEDLLASIGEGSKPTFITKNLERIAKENGIEVTDKMSADDVINALKEKQSKPIELSTEQTGKGEDWSRDVESTAKALSENIKQEPDVIKDGDDLILRHGTPHDFSKFQLEKIGTGEGKQAFGYGLYFTDGSKIAEQYAKKLSEDKTGLVYEVKIKDGAKKEWVEWREPLEQDVENKLYDSLTDSERKQYEDYLDKSSWDNDHVGKFDELKRDEYGLETYDKPSAVGLIYRDLKDAFGQEKATEIFKRAGVDGIKYRSNAGRGDNFNYVVFDPNSIEIIKKEKPLLSGNPQKISEAYHKAKADGSNPELVKAVEDLLSDKSNPKVTEIESKKADIERRRQEELDKETPIKNENITVDFGGGVFVKYQVITYKNGSVKISTTSQKAKRYNELSNEVFKDYAKIDFESDAKGIIKTELVKNDYTDEQSQEIKAAKEKIINAKYDAELKQLEQPIESSTKPTTTEIEAKKGEKNKELANAFPQALELNDKGELVERGTKEGESEFAAMGRGILGYNEQYWDALKNNTNPKELDTDKLNFLREKYNEGKIKSLVDVFTWGNKKGREIHEKYEISENKPIVNEKSKVSVEPPQEIPEPITIKPEENAGVTEPVTKPISEVTETAKEQGTEKAVPEGTIETGRTEPEGETAVLEGEPELPQRKFTQQMLRSEDLLPEAKQEIAKTLNYVRQSHEMTLKEANEVIDKVGLDEAQNMVIGDNNLKPVVRNAVGMTLIKKFNELSEKATTPEEKEYYLDKSIQTATAVTERYGTEAGQSIEIFKLWSQLSPEGQLRAANQDMAVQAKEKLRRREKDINKIGKEFQKANEEAINEVVKAEILKEEPTEKPSRAQQKIIKAKEKRAAIIKKYKDNKGKNLFSSPTGLTPEGIEFVGNVAKTYIEEGIANIEVLVEKVIKHLEDVSGKKVTDEIKNQVREESDKMINKADIKLLREGLKEKKIKIADIVTKHYTDAQQAKKKLAQKLMDEADMSQSNAAALVKKVEDAFDRIATRKKRNILYNEKARFDKINNTLKGAKKVEKKTLADEIIRYSNLGAFENKDFADMIASKFGLGELAPEQAAKLIELAKKVEKAPEGTPKNNAMEDLLSYRANIRGNDLGETAQAVWYANVLSGYKTHQKNVISTFFNSMGELGAEMAKDPKAIPYLIGGYIKGLTKRGFVEARHTLSTGYSPIHIKKIEVPNVLERKKFKGGAINPANWFKYVMRMMVAEDVLSFQSIKEARAYQLARREIAEKFPGINTWSKKAWDEANKVLLHTKERYDDAYLTIKEEGLLDKKGNPTLAGKRRIYELMENSRPEKMVEDSYGFAAKGTFNHESEGSLGALTNAVSSALDSVTVGSFKPGRLVIPFTRIITNVVNNSLDYTPVGMVRAARGVRGFRSFEKNYITKPAFKELSREERQRLIAKASLGITLAATFQAMHQAGVIQVTGGGTGNPQKDEQLRQSGWQEYSIKIGDTYYSYKYTPLVFMLGYLGNMNDVEKYGEDDKKTLDRKMQVASSRISWQVVDMTWINSASTFLGSLAEPNPDRQSGQVKKALGGMARGFIPFSGAVTQGTQALNGIFGANKKATDGAFQSLVASIPIAQNMFNDKINALGEPIKVNENTTWYLPDFISTEKSDDVWQLLSEKNGWVAPINPKIFIIYDPKIDEERLGTPDEYYEFSKNRGTKIKDKLKEAIKSGEFIDWNTGEAIKLKDVSSKDFNKWLSKVKSEATKEAKMELFGESPEKSSKNLDINQ